MFPFCLLELHVTVRNDTALQADLTCQPDPTRATTAIALRAPKRICNIYYEDCGNALTIVLIFPLAFGARRAPFGISIPRLLIATEVVQQHPLSVCADYVLHLHLSRL